MGRHVLVKATHANTGAFDCLRRPRGVSFRGTSFLIFVYVSIYKCVFEDFIVIIFTIMSYFEAKVTVSYNDLHHGVI